MDSHLATDIFLTCRTCTKKITSLSSFVYLNHSPAHTDLTIIQKLNNCIPELDLSITSNAVICSKCSDAIKFFYEFKQKCLELEIQINKYIQQVQHTGPVNLIEVVQLQSHNSCLDMKFKIEDIEITEDLVCDTNAFNEANEGTESGERTYLLTLQKVDSQYVLFNTVENYINDSLLAVEEYSDINNSDIAKDSCSQNLNKTDVYYQCYKCGHKAESKLKLILHLKRHTPNHLEIISKKPTKNYKNLFCYRCSLCNYLTKYKCLFHFHYRTHLTKKNYRNISQNKNVQTRSCASNLKVNKIYMRDDTTKYINHRYNQHSFKNQSKYIESTQNFSRRTTSKPNKRTVVAEKPFNCSICEYRSNQKKHLKSHMRMHARKKPFLCSVCDYQSSDKSNFKKHIRTHAGEKPFSCFVCEYRCTEKPNLRQHMRIHTGEKPFSCSICEYRCSSKSYIKRHMQTHTREKPFSCSVCEYRCSNKAYLKQHMLTHTGEKPFSCSVCEYQCSHKSDLNKHMRIHTGEKPFLCSVCEYQSSQKKSLKQHMRIHTGEKPFSCSVCKFQCSLKSSLKRHMRIHTGEKPFSCSVCEYQCTQKDSLKRHMLTHTQEKPFSCSACEYRCKDRESLKRHMRTHTEEKLFLCFNCKYQCGQKKLLIHHMKIHARRNR